ncbi:MAG TPA: CRTAC1 family protein [Vicinamibacterales bacterium]|nr:CRTAC1 family protein [Vicinamibacterales bacterium]
MKYLRPRRRGPAPPLSAAAVLAAAFAAFAGASADSGRRFHFVNVSQEAGLTRPLLAGRPGKDHLLDSAGAGAAFLDYDKDGRLDIYLVNGWRIEDGRIVERGRNALYRGLPDGTFREVTGEAGVAGEGHWGSGAFVADYDADGWPDILVTNFGPNILYRNLGNGRFENVAASAGVEAPGWNTGAAFFDADGDGDLDLYIAAYIDASLEDVLGAKRTLSWKGVEMVAFGPFGLKGAPDHFFRNEGGRFVDATVEAGLEDKALGFGFAVRAFDADDDGDPDLYVANDSDGNYLYRNEGGGRFREVGTWVGVALDEKGAAQAGMGLAVGDITNDGQTDIFVTNFADDFSTLYAGLGAGVFDDVSRASGIGPLTYKALSWGTAAVDLDHDTDLDLVVVNGHIYPQVDRHPDFGHTYAQPLLLAENRGPGASPQFVDATPQAGPGFEQRYSSRGLAVGDYDNDGDLDLLVTNLDAPPSLLRNDSRTGSWLIVALEGDRGTLNPVGAVVAVTAGGRTQRRDIAAGDSYMSTHDPRPHFGLGTAATVDEVAVRWPDGTRTVLKNVKANQILTVKKGS